MGTAAVVTVAVVAAVVVVTDAVTSEASLVLANAVSSSRKRVKRNVTGKTCLAHAGADIGARIGVNSQSLKHVLDPFDGAEACLQLVDELSR